MRPPPLGDTAALLRSGPCSLPHAFLSALFSF